MSADEYEERDNTAPPREQGQVQQEDEVQSSCCWCSSEHDDDFVGRWEVPAEVAFCRWCGTQIVDFREAQWPETYEHTVKLKARVACGHIKIIVPDKGVKLDTSCAGCITGWVWCGGYLGNVYDERAISLCTFAWWGCVKVYTATQWEKHNPPVARDDDEEETADASRNSEDQGPSVVSSQPQQQPLNL
mmetsp:Transcript_21420/g.55856  ORF Transcript_21420/g.55856 Transcript_21420/m.55856 type:complete len:189 (+) Transcript_21420:510-1076(+)|eukprot:CAMPEP_0182921756 /NCGR_PEP_ID=MMETSP0105_2-20130417/4344_1 /TAXON_ID=81532 ORGANISM="Acanthoeca-like sp., Strain 10tr" /NCGR_SAMPLE_ID=MMETSP0105_2 /ASSEMBLY_ACC=CAM_ASM_000205 /LENGTH=188 /DNA_ID=CAMNT_0025059303 /DNA_START=499 /DNA_END=1065 /DNA_ORIENTATION=+